MYLDIYVSVLFLYLYLICYQGSVLASYFTTGKLERSEGSSITEGIGQGRVTDNLKGAPIDGAFTVQDTDAVNMVRRRRKKDVDNKI